jgi:hypothetical protein
MDWIYLRTGLSFEAPPKISWKGSKKYWWCKGGSIDVSPCRRQTSAPKLWRPHGTQPYLISSDSRLGSLEAHTPAGRQVWLPPPPFMAYISSQLLGSSVALQAGRQAGRRPECQQISAARSATTQHKTKTQRHVIIDLIFMFPVFNSGLSVGGTV